MAEEEVPQHSPDPPPLPPGNKSPAGSPSGPPAPFRPPASSTGYGPAILALVAVVFLTALALVISFSDQFTFRMPLLVVVTILATFALLTFIATVYKAAWIHEWRMPLGLPEGSVRALIALGVIVVFAVITLFMLESLSAPEKPDSTLVKLVASATTTRTDTVSLEAAKTAGDVAKVAIDTIKTRQAAGQDLAKQLLTMLGTLLAAISSFYFGASVTASGANAGARMLDNKNSSPQGAGGGAPPVPQSGAAQPPPPPVPPPAAGNAGGKPGGAGNAGGAAGAQGTPEQPPAAKNQGIFNA